LVERLVSDRERLVTDAEALQEILHRYVAIRRPDSIQPAFDALLGIADQVFAIDQSAVERPRKSYWAILVSPLAMPSISRSWSNTKSTVS
jgi:hypothetical protein